VVSRPVTNTPLQALVMLNDVQYVEAARAFGQRLALLDAKDDAGKIQWGVLEALSRPATEKELTVLTAALKRERARYAQDAAAAQALVAVGEAARDRKLPVVEHAAWTQVGAILLNLSEVVTKN
jgi:hypothetical protein